MAALITLQACRNKPNTNFRQRIAFNKDWRFQLDSAGDWSQPNETDSTWRKLDLPHDWSIEGKFSAHHPAGYGGGALPGGTGWYRKTFVTENDWMGKQVYIEFDGIYQHSEVWINGHHLGKRPNGYISFRYDLTPYLKSEGETNVLAVKADNSQQPNSRWYSGSGIYRNVWLVTTEAIAVAHWGTFVTTPHVSEVSAQINLAATVSNKTDTGSTVFIKTIVLNPAGNPVAEHSSASQHIEAGGNALFEQQFTVDNPQRWDINAPNLYRTVTYVYARERQTDSYETDFGIRDFRFDPETGFFLNGRPFKIRGVCLHHDLGALGAAFNMRAAERQLEIMKAMGVNSIRTAHNPPAPELLDLCDRMGFLVMNETFDVWAKGKSEYDYHLDWADWHEHDLRDHILRDRNHPSVFIWSVGNELPEQWSNSLGDTTGRSMARRLVEIVKSLDTTREITTGNNEVGKGNNLLLSGAFDMIGYNYNHGQWKDFLQHHPQKKFIVTESTSALSTRGHYDLFPADSLRLWPVAWDIPFEDGNADHTVSAYDHVQTPWGSTHEKSLRIFEQYPHISGMYVWTGFDYLGEPTPYRWPARSSYFGIVDLAGFPKDTYYLYQSVWTDNPVLHLLPHWNWQAGDTVDVVAYYSQADEVELLLNGQSQGIRHKENGHLHVKWRVPYERGKVDAISRKDGREVLRKTVHTAGDAQKLVLEPYKKTIEADGRDLAFVTVRIVDEKGNTVPFADNEVRFTVEGAGILKATDNGNPVDHTSFQSPIRNAMNGMVLAIVQSDGKKGNITVKAEVLGLKPAVLVVEAK